MRGPQRHTNLLQSLPRCGKRLVHVLASLLLIATTASVDSLRGQDLIGGSERQGLEHVPFDLDRFTQQADVIVHGIVSSKEARWVDQALYTHYQLVVRETLHGAARSSIMVAILGGTLGNIGLEVPDAPKLSVGDEIVFFGQEFKGHPSFKSTGLGSGVVRVTPGSDGQTRFVTPQGKAERLDGFLDAVRSQQGARGGGRSSN